MAARLTGAPQASHDRNPLLLPPGELHSPLAHLGIVPVRQRHDEIVGVGLQPECFPRHLARHANGTAAVDSQHRSV